MGGRREIYVGQTGQYPRGRGDGGGGGERREIYVGQTGQYPRGRGEGGWGET